MRGQPRASRIAQRLRDAGGELALAAGQRCDAALARVEIARRRVDQHALQRVLGEPRGDFRRRHVVRERKLHGAKAGTRRRAEPIEERHFVEQEAQVGGQARHASRGENARVEFARQTRRLQGSRRRTPHAGRLSQNCNAPATVRRPGVLWTKTVNMRWNEREYAANGAAMGCFCCRFSTPLLCIKKRLPSVPHPTMLGAHQALQHKM